MYTLEEIVVMLAVIAAIIHAIIIYKAIKVKMSTIDMMAILLFIDAIVILVFCGFVGYKL